MKEFKHLPGLDLIRVFGILVVVFYHYQVETAVRGLCPADFLPAMEPLVQVAVYTMTLLSGSCLCWQEKSRSWSMKRYLWGRFLAIYPLFWLCFFPIFFYSDIICGNNEGVAPWKLLLSIVGVDGYFQSFTPTFYKIGVLQIKVNRFCRKSPKKYSADSRVKMRTANRTPSKIGGSQMA